ncbi:dTDP-4-dehydrorhamnose 3,5-epimerase [Pseudoalteromonas neustonica]|uniref:dTDP-4-dehydrorhamnose 3,5-epimerase n=1 Tax=Pseudoalteromonas neustonica TaxID=1840331 RepID=A0ABU9U0E3_9GAMM|nr:dTDP-4-dehydrorhamnose 3,5-epimerase [Pseudoalteromonas sp. NEC-BIFX-2020_015]NMR23959.1 dTDP-4-dehydrorhamnose 3,5-epimerase [Pseudoalteromonas sp. NEC-BIFX-2020_015]
MNVIDTPVLDLKIIEPTVFGDERGFFLETFREQWFKEHVADVTFVQDNHSKSSRGILRGMHYQTQQTQGKLVHVVQGTVYDVAIDMRQSSSTFGQWFGIVLSAENKRQLWVPAGFAHGFYVTSDTAEFVYKCTDYYAPQFEQSVCWNDPQLEIDWPISPEDTVQLSAKDESGLLFKDAPYF